MDGMGKETNKQTKIGEPTLQGEDLRFMYRRVLEWALIP